MINPVATTVPAWTLPVYDGKAQIRRGYTAADPTRRTLAERAVRGSGSSTIFEERRDAGKRSGSGAGIIVNQRNAARVRDFSGGV